MSRRRVPFAIRLAAVLLVLGTALPFVIPSAQAQTMASYYEQNQFLEAPATSFREGLAGFANPALTTFTQNQFVFAWTSPSDEPADVDDWGVFSSVGNDEGGLGTSLVRVNQFGLSTTTLGINLSGGSPRGSFGVGYQVSYGDATALGRVNRLVFGTASRPNRFLSIGLTANVSVENDDTEYVGALGIRPLGTPRWTVFADGAVFGGNAIQDAPWSVGTAVEVVRGVDLVGRYFENETFTAGLRLELGRLGLGSQARGSSDDYAGQIHRVRLGAYTPSAISDRVQRQSKRIDVPVNAAPYRTPVFSFGGDDGPRFYPTLRSLRQAREDDRVSAVVIDLSTAGVSPEKAWELRTEIGRLRQSGKHVIAFVRNPDMTTYHLASAANDVVMEPQGFMTLPGYALSRTFLDGTLDKLGLEFQEFRFFEYKSAAEVLSRTGFSEADSLQRQEFVNDQYALTRQDVTTSRNLSPDAFDRIVNETAVLSAREALQEGLVDTLARWDTRDDVVKALLKDDPDPISRTSLDEIATASRRWGPNPQIAVVYGIGPTEIDSGIEAKKLAKTFRDLKDDSDVRAVVFRVDSPGGSGIASDIAAEALRELAKEKPVIVSQGQVAGSGGYWISAYADAILAGPNTITGSIGVIGGWLYEDGLSDDTGLTYDVVKQGDRADLLTTGYTLPLLGVQIPTRRLDEEEFDRVRSLFDQFYTQFVQVVAEGRDTTEAHVREIGEGRIYSGLDGKEVGLVDEIGGLMDAIALARREAGLERDAVQVREVNATRGFLDLSRLLPSPVAQRLGLGSRGDESKTLSPEMQYLRVLLETQPAPAVLMPADVATWGQGKE